MPPTTDYIDGNNILSLQMVGRWPTFLLPEVRVTGGGSGPGHGSCETGQTGRGTSRSGQAEAVGQKRVDCNVVESRVSQIIEDAVEDLGFQLVRVRFSGTKNGRNQLQIMAEPKEDREMTVEDCETLSRHVAALLDVDDPITSAYILEVSSPGIDRPLTRIEDYDRFAGELAKLTLRFMLDGRKRFNGRLGGRNEDGKIIIDTAFGKFAFAFEEIDSARIDPTEIFTREATTRS